MSEPVVDPAERMVAPTVMPPLALLGAGSPVLQLLGLGDSADGMVCGLDGVCRPAGEPDSAGPPSPVEHDSSTAGDAE